MSFSKSLAMLMACATFSPLALSAPLISYRCDDGQVFQVAYPDRDHAILIYDGDATLLRIGVSASGGRYIGEGWQWWIKGQEEGNLAVVAGNEKQATDPGRMCHREQKTPR